MVVTIAAEQSKEMLRSSGSLPPRNAVAFRARGIADVISDPPWEAQQPGKAGGRPLAEMILLLVCMPVNASGRSFLPRGELPINAARCPLEIQPRH